MAELGEYLRIETYERRTKFAPGDSLDGLVTWRFDHPPEALELRLLWSVQGMEKRDVQVIARVRYERPAAADSQTFSLNLPNGPYSFQGKYATLTWSLELVGLPDGPTTCLPFEVGPAGQAVDLYKYAPADDSASSAARVL